jgi:hypothetical protein
MDRLFGNNNPAPSTPSATSPANPAELNTSGNPALGTNPTVPATVDANGNPVTPTTPATPATPLDAFAKLWEDAPNPTGDNANAGLFNVDPEKLKAAAASVDFTKSLTPELMQQIAGGGENAMKAVMEAMNKTAQATYAQSAMATTKIVEKAVEKANADFMAKIPSMLKSQNLSNSLLEENPALSHPAAAPLIDAVQKQLTTKYPNATSSELNKMAKEYLSEFANVAVVKPAPETPKPAKGEVDWSQFLG